MQKFSRSGLVAFAILFMLSVSVSSVPAQDYNRSKDESKFVNRSGCAYPAHNAASGARHDVMEGQQTSKPAENEKKAAKRAKKAKKEAAKAARNKSKANNNNASSNSVNTVLQRRMVNTSVRR